MYKSKKQKVTIIYLERPPLHLGYNLGGGGGPIVVRQFRTPKQLGRYLAKNHPCFDNSLHKFIALGNPAMYGCRRCHSLQVSYMSDEVIEQMAKTAESERKKELIRKEKADKRYAREEAKAEKIKEAYIDWFAAIEGEDYND